jgi:hypothetical protein
MWAARGYESPIANLNPGQLSILQLQPFSAPEPYRNRDGRNSCLQSLLNAALSSATSVWTASQR